MIDLSSDTQTRPSPAMREFMAAAPVGDEQLREDPSVNRLQEMAAALLGKEAALFLPSGTMCNAIAFSLNANRGEAVVLDQESHPNMSEAGGPAWLASVMLRPVAGPRGIFTVDQSPPAAEQGWHARGADGIHLDREHDQSRRRRDLAARAAGGDAGAGRRPRSAPAHGRGAAAERGRRLRHPGRNLRLVCRFRLGRSLEGPGRSGRRRPGRYDGVHRARSAAEAHVWRGDAPGRDHRRRRYLRPRAQCRATRRGPRQRAVSGRGSGADSRE